jgi:hypothetical protein
MVLTGEGVSDGFLLGRRQTPAEVADQRSQEIVFRIAKARPLPLARVCRHFDVLVFVSHPTIAVTHPKIKPSPRTVEFRTPPWQKDQAVPFAQPSIIRDGKALVAPLPRPSLRRGVSFLVGYI